MRKGSWVVAILILGLVPVSGRAAVDTRVITARGTATSNYGESHNDTGQSYDLYGTFKVNGLTYTGHVAGYWTTGYATDSNTVFSGSSPNGVINGSCYPHGGLVTLVGVDSLVCQFSIDYTRTAQFTLYFYWITSKSQPCVNCTSIDYTGVFVGV